MLDVADLADLKRLLIEHPEWRAELRQLLLTEEVLGLPAAVRELVEAQRHTDETLAGLAARVDQLAARVDQLAARVDQLAARLDQLAERLDQLAERVAELADAQRRTEETLRVVVTRQDDMRGDILEMRYARRAHAYFGRVLRRLRVVVPGQLSHELEDRLREALSDLEWDDVLSLDLLAVGTLAQARPGEDAEAWIAVEVSAVIDAHDVERAVRRAGLLRKAGIKAMPVVAGNVVSGDASAALQGKPVVLVLDGRSEGWEAAVAAISA